MFLFLLNYILIIHLKLKFFPVQKKLKCDSNRIQYIFMQK